MILAVTPGDPQGIGPEIVWNTIESGRFKNTRLLCVGAREPFDRMGVPVREISAAELLREKPSRRKEILILAAPKRAPRVGAKAGFLPGYQSGWAIEAATSLVRQNLAQAIVTGPISKERLQKGGYFYPGHTEFLADLCGVKHVTMMLANEQLRITLVTTHLALKDVPKALTRTALRRCIQHTADHLHRWWAIPKPRLGIAALNPHAGEGGMFGREEIRVITPELQALSRTNARSFELHGPLPADTLFAKHIMEKSMEDSAHRGEKNKGKPRPKDSFDAVVCMYHDQGLIPVKLLDFPKTVNVTLGLPIIRTSVDHGVGFDIAGKGVADPSSLQAALRMALELAENTQRLKLAHNGTS